MSADQATPAPTAPTATGEQPAAPARPAFRGGVNIAMKIPRAEYDATVSFYRDALGLEVTEEEDTGAASVTRTHRVAFGPVTLWLDRVDGYPRSDVWLQVETDDLAAATERLTEAGGTVCDEVERFADPATRAHWVKSPAGVVHLLSETLADETAPAPPGP